MSPEDVLKSALGEAVQSAAPGLAAANALCHACVELLDVDGAAISLFHDGKTHGTFGASGEFSRRLDELQFTFGEGPCATAVREARPVLVPDLAGAEGERWPAYGSAALALGVRAVFALPVSICASPFGVLDLFRGSPGPLLGGAYAGSLLAAELAALPLLDLMSAEVDWSALEESGDAWSQLASLERVEVYQATGMIMGQLGVGPAEALVRLRAAAFSKTLTASQLAWQIVEGHFSLEPDDSWRIPPPETEATG
ncbi:MAG TPA: GAF and ANTAR domain-containing protein [Mycobacteriales bacterium]|nr:GAF and ANTAR domain-containing protein [Mycobacteriales bacterium]